MTKQILSIRFFDKHSSTPAPARFGINSYIRKKKQKQKIVRIGAATCIILIKRKKKLEKGNVSGVKKSILKKSISRIIKNYLWKI